MNEKLIKFVDLVEELCEAVDNECSDIGGSRGSLTILREIGPLIESVRSEISLTSGAWYEQAHTSEMKFFKTYPGPDWLFVRKGSYSDIES